MGASGDPEGEVVLSELFVYFWKLPWGLNGIMFASVWQSIEISSLTVLSFLLLSDSLGEVDDDINPLSSRRPWLRAWLNGGQSVHSTDKCTEHLLRFRIWARPLLPWSLQCPLETTHKQVNMKVRVFRNDN